MSRALFTYLIIRKNLGEVQRLSKLFQVLAKFISKNLPN